MHEHLSGSRAGNVYELHDAIYAHWADMGYAQSPLGLPVSDQYSSNGGDRSDFEGGYIHWTAAGEAQVTYTGSVNLSQTAVIKGGAWLQITSGTGGTNSGTIEVTCTENTGATERVGTIDVTATSGAPSSASVKVRQGPGEHCFVFYLDRDGDNTFDVGEACTDSVNVYYNNATGKIGTTGADGSLIVCHS